MQIVTYYTDFVEFVKKKMLKSTKKIEGDLLSLAKLLGYQHKQGWKSRLSDWLNVDIRVLSNWIVRNKIPKRALLEIEKRGYPQSLWIDLENTPPASKSQPESTISPKKGLTLEEQVEVLKENRELKQLIALKDQTIREILARFRSPTPEERRQGFHIIKTKYVFGHGQTEIINGVLDDHD